MLSVLEYALLCGSQAKGSSGVRRGFRETLFDLLDDGQSLLRLRAASRQMHHIIGHRPGRLFRRLYVKAPMNDEEDQLALERAAPFCHSLTITITSTEMEKSLTTDLARGGRNNLLELVRGRNAQSRMTTSSYDAASIYSTVTGLTARMSVPPAQLSHSDQVAQELSRRQWLSIFSCFRQLQTLTFRIHGDPAWPGRNEVEDLLITIRAALEQTDLPHLTEVQLKPIHAMGIVHLRWTGLSAFGPPPRLPTPTKPPIIWHRLTILDIHLRNPFTTSQLTPAQRLMFKKLLYDYLRAFTSTLQSLRFVWLDGEGPSPLTLHHEDGLARSRLPLQWHVLETLWLGNITFPHSTIALASRMAPKLKGLWMLRSTCMNERRLNLDAHDMWVEVLSRNQTSAAAGLQDNTSSVSSQSARTSATPWASGISRVEGRYR
ncbi:hypothetical protein BAUCODRAFT_148834 [Baudoinia panamericana UAMH 10762]|uniref:Uncharacterized protein n=1 Tax=Baudoinia panamericana (strain UAMH 10762) TaxID=717646 RepID=M2MHD2_BAUPA|nr:uncharacterized protein BAUCODRAFT_148834 [Baudoinia panamericana UAMH 10762]EMC95996.1 hypothetical protein BAUCODRAFT_148834 [Baudoinia panamericana UAMH 10762]